MTYLVRSTICCFSITLNQSFIKLKLHPSIDFFHKCPRCTAFVIKMPIMHRLACLRDDVIFLIFCYQRYKYKTDYTRVNEYGQCAQPTEEMLKESKKDEDECKNENDRKEEIIDQDVSNNVRRRRNARDRN